MNSIDEKKIISLFNERDERAISEIKRLAGKLVLKLTGGILSSREDIEECENDVYLALWNSIPPNSPDSMLAYTCRIARNIAYSRARKNNSGKRKGELVALEELSEILPGKNVEEEIDAKLLGAENDRFLDGIEEYDRTMFVLRYWYGITLDELAEKLSCTKNTVNIRLCRTRKKLKTHLEKKGFL